MLEFDLGLIPGPHLFWGMFPTVQVIFKYCGTVTNVIPEGKFDECGLG